MKADIRELIQKERLYFDGGTGTVLQGMGLAPGEPPERWNLEHPERITALHRAYLEAGSNIILTNTFGVNCEKYPNYEQLIRAAVGCAREAAAGYEKAFVALDLGPTGQLLEPLGALSFERAVEIFASSVRAGADGADLIVIETMNDILETKAAVLAARENCTLPVFVTNVYDADGKLMTGSDPETMIAMLEGLRVDALGLNCSLGPDKMLPLIARFAENTRLPIIVSPNAGLPVVRDGKTVFDVDAHDFAALMRRIACAGGCILGGCCGTTPAYIERLIAATRDVPYRLPAPAPKTVVSSYTHAVTVGEQPLLIGERINPTGKPRLKEALRRGDMAYLLNEAVRQSEAGVQILDVNVGLPEIDEVETMYRAVKELQAVSDLPLQLDSSDPAVLERAMRVYNGKPLINSVNGTEKSMSGVFPLIQKYGGAVVALTIDEDGIPATAAARAAVAEKIAARAAEYGISRSEIIVDPLAMAVSSDADSALVTLEALRLIRAAGLKTVLGVSNISFGLPRREKINSAFFAAALENGLNCAIMNPFSEPMTDVYYAFRALHGLDSACADYITYADASAPPPATSASDGHDALKNAVVRGIRADAESAARELLGTLEPLEVINRQIVPALNEIGTAFEQKKAYLPQLLMSAEAASAAFEIVKQKLPAGASDHGAVILATVKGDIHDIGKNIVKVLLESYGFRVYDLGRDVPPERVVQCVRETGCRLVGLSALMTTTVPAMEETIRQLKAYDSGIQVVVGGAVLNQEYADLIGADCYSPDAMDTVRYAESYYNGYR